MSKHTHPLFIAFLLPILLAGCGGGAGVVSQANAAPGVNAAPSANEFHGIAVPPEPDPVTNAALLGVDANNNGVRDDVEREIARVYGGNPDITIGALAVAKANQGYLSANGDVQKSTTATSNAVLAGACIAQKLKNRPIDAYKVVDYIFSITFNTSERLSVYRMTSSSSREVFTQLSLDSCK